MYSQIVNVSESRVRQNERPVEEVFPNINVFYVGPYYVLALRNASFGIFSQNISVAPVPDFSFFRDTYYYRCVIHFFFFDRCTITRKNNFIIIIKCIEVYTYTELPTIVFHLEHTPRGIRSRTGKTESRPKRFVPGAPRVTTRRSAVCSARRPRWCCVGGDLRTRLLRDENRTQNYSYYY